MLTLLSVRVMSASGTWRILKGATNLSLKSHLFSKLISCRMCSASLSQNRQFSSSKGDDGQTSPSGSENEDLVIVEKVQMQHLITTIGINRPEKRNCVNHATALKLEEAIKNFEDDPTSAAAVLYGKGGNFCAGYDLDEVSHAAEAGSIDFLASDNFNPSNRKGLGPMGPSRRFFKKPVIAAISGYAVAGGLELALMCDIRIVEDTAVLGVFCRRFGVPLIDGGTVRLPHLIGLSRAMDLILTGRPVKAKEAFEIGLCNSIVACGTSLGQGIQYANQLSKFPQECLNKDRMSAYNAVYAANNFEDAVKYEMENGLEVFQSESIRGATKFVEDDMGKHGSFNMNNLPPKEWNSKKSKL
ncbi:unnamed protein product [Orchesella dallaii]|uniref:Enoyl-CoA hydratase n=1 Tax=Orchesella dallaii TaxID=48710 RepID=A0ABP1QV20_9HEXA